MLTKYLGEEGDNARVKAAMTVCNPFQFDIPDDKQRKFWEVYSRGLASNLKRKVLLH